MKLKLDLHPIFSDSRSIESSLEAIIDEAVEKHASEVEIIPGKGSGALKKTVLRYLDRPDVKAKYHRVDKDSDNWGRLFVYFRHEKSETGSGTKASSNPKITVAAKCVCCTEPFGVELPAEVGPTADGKVKSAPETSTMDCPWCGSPHRITFRVDRRNFVYANAELNY